MSEKILMKFTVRDENLVPAWVPEKRPRTREEEDMKRVKEAEELGDPSLAALGRVRANARDTGQNVLHAEDVSVNGLPAQLAAQGFTLCADEVHWFAKLPDEGKKGKPRYVLVLPLERLGEVSEEVVKIGSGDDETAFVDTGVDAIEALEAISNILDCSWTVDVWENPGRPTTVNCRGRRETKAKGILTYVNGVWDVGVLPEADDGLDDLEIDVSEFDYITDEEILATAEELSPAYLDAYGRQQLAESEKRLGEFKDLLDPDVDAYLSSLANPDDPSGLDNLDDPSDEPIN